jgi:hypothetical protein
VAISSEYVPVKVSGDGVTAEFSFPFRIFEASDLTVLILNKTTDEVLFTRVLGTHYTVEINRVTEGGAITFGGSFIPTSEQNVFIASEIPNTQPTSYILGGKLAEKSFEAMGDRLLRLIQQVLRKVDRSVKLPETDLGDAPVLPAAESGKAIGWDGAGGLTNMTLDPGTALSAASQADAEAGTDNVGYMTALRTKQAIDANTPEIASQADAEAGVNNTKFMTPLRTKQAIDENEVVPAFENALLHVRDEKTANTNGGTFTSGDWRTRTLNTVKTNQITGASLGSDQITLPAGTYDIYALAPGALCQAHKAKLRNVSDSADAILGQSTGAGSSGGKTQTNSVVSGRFTIAAEKVFELQHRCETTRNDDGFGQKSNFSVIEVYAEVKIWKVA